jgi:hypothetical protein
MQGLAWMQIGGVSVRYWARTFDDMLGKIVKHWQNDKDKTVSNLMWIAHHCLSAPKSCT